MSIFATTASIRARQDEADSVESQFVSDTDAGSLVQRLTAFVPAEMITIWGVLLTLLAPKQDWIRWALLAVAVVVLLLLLHLDLALKNKEAKKHDEGAQPVNGTRRFRAFGLASVSFVVWALATPGTPLDGNQGRIAVAIAVVLTAIVTRCAKLWDIEPTGS
jgi:glucose uptake protein GlcU